MHAGEMVAEAICGKLILKPGIGKFTVDGLEHFEQGIKSGKAVLAMSGHLGPIEILAAYFSKTGYSVAPVYRKANYKIADWLIQKLRDSHKLVSIGRSGVISMKQIIRVLKSPSLLSLLIDQDIQAEATFVPFFGKLALYPSSLVDLSIRYGNTLCPIFIVRRAPLEYYIRITKIEIDPKAPDALSAAIYAYTEKLEEMIRLYPEQWIWWHRRWRRRPGIDYTAPGVFPRSTAEYISWLKSGAKDSE